MSDQGAIGAAVAFVIGLYFAIPSQANIGYIIVDALASGLSSINIFMFKAMFIVLGFVIIFVDILYIIEQCKKGNW